MTIEEVMKELREYADEKTKNIFLKHGAQEPYFGVKVQDMKKIVKKVKKDHKLSLELYDTRNGDAMYLAGLIADEKQITKEDLSRWVREATWYMISEYTVPWVASESPFGYELGLEWIESEEEKIATSGWATLASVASFRPDESLDIQNYEKLLNRVGRTIHQAKNRVRYTMNGFVIAVGGSIPSLTESAQKVAEKIGKVNVEMGGTACKVPLATLYIQKIIDRGSLGKKRKTARC